MLKVITKIKDIYSSNYMNQNINNKNISNMKIKNNSNKLLILLTIVFGMGFSSRVVFGSSEPVYSNIYLKFNSNQEIESSDPQGCACLGEDKDLEKKSLNLTMGLTYFPHIHTYYMSIKSNLKVYNLEKP